MPGMEVSCGATMGFGAAGIESRCFRSLIARPFKVIVNLFAVFFVGCKLFAAMALLTSLPRLNPNSSALNSVDPASMKGEEGTSRMYLGLE